MSDAAAWSATTFSGGARGGVKAMLRLEGLAVLALSLLFYDRSGESWLWFAVFFLAPDLSMLGYLAGPRLGAFCYNAAHSYVGPVLAVGAGAVLAVPLLSQIGLIWSAHIGFDRLLGYGLKYQAAFGWTHLGAIGKAARG